MKLKKEQAAQIKEIQDREKEFNEMKEVYRYQDSMKDKKLDMKDFKRRYENQVKQWEARKAGLVSGYDSN